MKPTSVVENEVFDGRIDSFEAFKLRQEAMSVTGLALLWKVYTHEEEYINEKKLEKLINTTDEDFEEGVRKLIKSNLIAKTLKEDGKYFRVTRLGKDHLSVAVGDNI